MIYSYGPDHVVKVHRRAAPPEPERLEHLTEQEITTFASGETTEDERRFLK
jgi:hypothetical protein